MVRFNRLLSVAGSGEVRTTNLLAFVFACLTALLEFIILSLFGWGDTSPYIFLMALLFLLVIVLNQVGYYSAGRLLFCLLPVWFPFFISIYGKIEYPDQSFIAYFDIRYILLATAIAPPLIFDTQERWKILICLASTFFCLFFFDPVNNWLGIGFYQRGFKVASYYYVNYVVFISFLALVAGAFILKWRYVWAHDEMLQSLDENKKINLDLAEKNQELQNLTYELEAQNEEIRQQQEEMTSNQEMLASANKLISEQKQKLELYNSELEKLVEEKSGDLIKTNSELVQTNNELRQFSFNVSHNLRGPVARILGLTNLLNNKLSMEELPQAVSYIQTAASDLDGVLKDLSTIIDIRNELYRVREKINLDNSWEQALTMIGPDTIGTTTFNKDFSGTRHVFGIRPMVQSILYNLVSNAIKYKSPDRNLIITGKSWTHHDQTIIEISDNGLGIDVSRFKDDIFRLYKRFHTHVAGKGMGLYLVRSQMQIMGGRVEVEGAVNHGTTFRLYFPVPTDADKQIFFENESAQLYYDAFINTTFIIWKKNVTSFEYQEVFEAVLNSLRKYNTPGWIADVRLQGIIPMNENDKAWGGAKDVLSMATSNGLRRIGMIGLLDDPIYKNYYQQVIQRTKEFGIELRVFGEIQSAILWMKNFD